MEKYKLQKIFIFLCVFEVYFISFFFVFHRISITTELVYDERPECKGPKGISVVAPLGNRHVSKVLYYAYYPIHTTFKEKGWMYPVNDKTIIYEDD